MIARVHRVLNATECMFEMIKGKNRFDYQRFWSVDLSIGITYYYYYVFYFLFNNV